MTQLEGIGNVNIYIMTWIKKHLKVSVPSPLKQDEKKNEVNLRANRNTQKSETDAGKSTSSLSGGIDYNRGNLNLNASGDTNKNYNVGLRLSNKKGNVSGGVNYNKTNFGNNIGGNLKIKF